MVKVYATFILLLVSSAVISSEKINIAVNELSGQGINESDAVVISDRLRSELTSTESFRVMERAQMENILKEQGFQQTGCTDNSCAVEMGQLLGVEHMVFGNIGKLGSLFTINLRLVNVATGELLYTVTEDRRCTIEEVLTEQTKTIAMKLDLAIQKAIFGTLDIKTIPEGASFNINDKKVGVTNYYNDRFVPGKYKMDLVLDNYEIISQEVIVEKEKTINLEFKLERTEAYKDSVKNATKKQRRKRLLVRQLIFGGLTLASGGLGLYFNKEADDSKTDESAAKQAYLNAGVNSSFDQLYKEYEGHHADVNENIKKRNIFYGIAGGFGLCFTISLAF